MDYKRFFSQSKNLHCKKNIVSSSLVIGDKDKKLLTNIPDICKNFEFKENIFLKVDIEGGEYEILKDIISIQSKLTGAVIEFHNCHVMKNHIKNFIEEFELDLVHIHVNNFGEVTKSSFPTVIEMTFSKKKFNTLRSIDDFNFPDQSLDFPNNPEKEDKQLDFE